MVCETSDDVSDLPKVIRCLTSSISAKQNGYERIFAPLAAQACLYALPGASKEQVAGFNVDDVRVAKIVGGGVSEATVLRGVVCTRDSEGTIKSVKNAHVAVYQHGMHEEIDCIFPLLIFHQFMMLVAHCRL